VDWFSEIVIDGFAAAIVASVRYLLAQIDPAQLNRPDAVPLLEVRSTRVRGQTWKCKSAIPGY
jgi:hypothetical protein